MATRKAATATTSARTPTARKRSTPATRTEASAKPARPSRAVTRPAPEFTPVTPLARTPAVPLTPQPGDVDHSLQEAYATLDRTYRARLGHLTGGLSPIQTTLAYLDWAWHLMAAPGKQLELWHAAALDAEQVAHKLVADAQAAPEAAESEPRYNPRQPGVPKDKRFNHPGWAHWPFNMYAQNFLALERAWDRATHHIPGMSRKTERTASFAARQLLDMVSPNNVPWLNPQVLQVAADEHGQNFVRGLRNWADDMQRSVRGLPPEGVEAFKVGENVAVTPGKVVYQNDLMELIQYSPTTEKVHAEPVLIVPAWIMKYYILDLSPENSLVKYLVDQGHTVFMISWKNPTSIDRDRGMDDYRRLGVMAAIDTVSEIVPNQKIHAAGYCLGGTMLMIAAATMGREGDHRLGSMTLLAAQGDFTEAGELLLFINESEVSLIEAMMWEQGVLEGKQMAGAFQLLRSNDLIWSRMLKEYMLGRRDAPNDLMAWNADTTRMPYRMHSEYLNKLFLRNELATGHYEVDGAPIWFTDIHVPCFAVGTDTDHVAPWKSVYKMHLLPVDMTFVLTSGGHNAGIVSQIENSHRHYRIEHRPADQPYEPPETWKEHAPRVEGSWWPAWHQWLAAHSSGQVAPPRMGLNGNQNLPDAPGSYVLEA
ncbi:PHA/PHB synthase family protein [Aquabacterium sp.]|uniref:PHA/PHB synthase family protein n=1 Tax=Aquabacterium sp. TaxID=1872578 RepID=UPI0035B02E0D